MGKGPFFWVKKIAAEWKEVDTIPLFGKAPPFDWADLASHLTSTFGIEIKINPLGAGWKNLSEIKKGLGAHATAASVHLIPLGASLFWMMPKGDLEKLTSRILYGKGKGKTSEIVREGFYRYLLLQTLNCLQGIDPFKKMTLQLEEESEPSDEKYFCTEIEIGFDDKTCWGELLIPIIFREKWVEYFSRAPSEYFPTELAKQTELVLGLKVAETSLLQSEWDELEAGDFLTLDRCSYDLNNEDAVATLLLNETPLFLAKVKKNQIELLDYTFTYEDTMEQKKELQPADEETTSLKDVPLNVTVELARLKMSLDQLLHLSPGNMLDLPIQPEQGVSLCVQGKKIGTAELVHLGDVLGIRILTLGS